MARDSQNQIAELQRQVKALAETLADARNEVASFKKSHIEPLVKETTVANMVNFQIVTHMEKFLGDLQGLIDKTLQSIRVGPIESREAAPIDSREAIRSQDAAGDGGAQRFIVRRGIGLPIQKPRAKRVVHFSPLSGSKTGAESGSPGSSNPIARLLKENIPNVTHQKHDTTNESRNVVEPIEEPSVAASQHDSHDSRPGSPPFVLAHTGSRSPERQRLLSSAFIGPMQASIHAPPSPNPPNEINKLAHLPNLKVRSSRTRVRDSKKIRDADIRAWESQITIRDSKTKVRRNRTPRKFMRIDELGTLVRRTIEKSPLSQSYVPSPSTSDESASEQNESKSSVYDQNAGAVSLSNQSAVATDQSGKISSGSCIDKDDDQTLAPLTAIKEIKENDFVSPWLELVPLNMVGVDEPKDDQNNSVSRNKTLSATAASVQRSSLESPPLVSCLSPVQSTESRLKSDYESASLSNVDLDFFTSSFNEQVQTKPVSPPSDEEDHGPLIPVSLPKPKSTQNPLDKTAGSQPPPDFDPFSKLTHNMPEQPCMLENPKYVTARSSPEISAEAQAELLHEQNKAALEKFISRHQTQLKNAKAQPGTVDEKTIPTDFNPDYVGPTPSFTRELGSQLDKESKKMILRRSSEAEPTNVDLGSTNLPPHLANIAWQDNGLTWVPTDKGNGFTVWKRLV